MTSVSRITHHSIGMTSLAGLQGNLTRMGKLQEQLSSGKQIARPSDSPSGTVSAMEVRGQLRAAAQYSRNSTDGIGWLSTLDTTMTSASTMLGRARELTLQGMNTGVSSEASRNAMATEVEAIRDGLLALANTTYMNRPIFGGTTTSQTAYNSAGAFVGDTNPVTRRVGDNTTVRIDANGPEVFGTSPNDLFTTLANIANHMRNDPGALTGDLTVLDNVRNRLQNALSDVGARQSRVEAMRDLSDDRGITLRGTLSEIEDIDMPATIVSLQMQEASYKAALGATAKIIQPSLVDFLR